MDWFIADGYEIARLVLQRGVALLYVVAFVAVLHQFPALLGERGLLPVPRFTARVPARSSPSLFHRRYSDGPTGALDHETSRDVMQALLHATAASGRTLVVVTHDDDVAAQCARVVRLRDGRVVADTLGRS